eukprot:UN02896
MPRHHKNDIISDIEDSSQYTGSSSLQHPTQRDDFINRNSHGTNQQDNTLTTDQANNNIDWDEEDDDDVQYINDMSDIYKDKRFDVGSRTWRAMRHFNHIGLQEIVDIIGPYAFYALQSIVFVLMYPNIILHFGKPFVAAWLYHYNYNTIYPIATIIFIRFIMDSIHMALMSLPLNGPQRGGRTHWRAATFIDLAHLIFYTMLVTADGFTNAAAIPSWVKMYAYWFVLIQWLCYTIAIC